MMNNHILRRTPWLAILAAAAVLSFFVAVAPKRASADTISTVPQWDGAYQVCCFGPTPAPETFGQTITVPNGDALLESWTFYMEMPTADQFQGELYAWNGTRATGADLWQGSLTSTTNPSEFQAITFDTGGIPVVPGDQYVIFASTSNGTQSAGSGALGMLSSTTTDGNQFVYLANGTDTSEWVTESWIAGFDRDLAFQVQLSASPSPVPEPGTILLLLTGLGILGIFTRRGSWIRKASAYRQR